MSAAPSRPRPDEAMKLRAALIIAKAIVADGPNKVEGAAEQIASIAEEYSDGYDLARDLERRHYWTPDAAMVEELDNYGSVLRGELEKAEKEWAETNQIKPPLPDGTVVKNKRGETGVIDCVSKYGAAKYAVIMDGDDRSGPPHNCRRIEKFEDVEAQS